MQYIRFLFPLIALICTVVGQCPIDVPIKSPCIYGISEPSFCAINCTGSEPFDIAATFSDLSGRLPVDREPFAALFLLNTGLEELPHNAFGGIQFNVIVIQNNIKRVNGGAFNGTAATLTQLYFTKSPVTEVVTNGSDLFGAINTLKALELLAIDETGVRALPTLCLSGLKKLRSAQFFNNPLRSISAHAFNELPMLELLRFGGTSPIERVAEHAFTVGPKTRVIPKFTLKFESQLNDPFDNRTFESIGRPTTIKLGQNSMKYLNSNEFNVFLSEDSNNTVFDESIDCADSRNQWIREKYPKVWTDLNCK